MPEAERTDSDMEGISERISEIPSCSQCGCGMAGVKGRDERKVRALDTCLPTQMLSYAHFSVRSTKKYLDNADAVIHGVC